MKKSKLKLPIKYAIERAVLSDVLPYETPIIFSNRHFYEFLINHKVKFDFEDNSFHWIDCKDENSIQKVIRILFDANGNSEKNKRKLNSRKKEFRKIAFNYKITHKEKDFRDLAIPHPKSQIELVSFYERYKELILYYSKESPYSIRKPDNIAKFVFSNDNTYVENRGDEDDFIEESGKEYKSLKTFFTYKRFSNIYKFYEHYAYHRAEKKYDKMIKFDIAKCFDSIYTHSLSWALADKEFVKENNDFKTFSGQFDKFMQNTNYGETNGIIIGPEFSRIFAELILQSIDKKIENILRDKGIYHKVHYEIYRYVDDFFVFYNNEKTKNEILDNYKIILKEYKLSLNNSKTIQYEKPLITEITIAKNKIINLLKEGIKFKISNENDKEDKEIPEEKIGDEDFIPRKKILVSDVDIRCDSNKLITEFKTIVVVSNVAYKDIMNYTLAIFRSSLLRNIKKYEEHKKRLDKDKFKGLLTKEEEKKLIKQEANFTKYIVEMLDFVFFLYGVSPKVNSTIKLVSILSFIIKSFRKKYKFQFDEPVDGKTYALKNQFDKLNQEVVFKKILDEIILILDKSKIDEHLQIETLYLMIVLKELGKEYRLTTEQLVKYLNLKTIKKDDGSKDYEFKNNINYFVITVLLFYFKDIKQYSLLKEAVKKGIITKIKGIEENKRTKHSELVLLFFDLISCPYLNEEEFKFKRQILGLFDIKTEKEEFIKFVIKQKYWFTKWDNFNLVEEMNAKSSLEPYS